MLRVRYYELTPDNNLASVNSAILECGCEVSLSNLDLSAENWQAAAQRKMDDNLRSVFG